MGDIMVDVDLYGRCDRLCQDGPWPVFSMEATRRRLGGAGNVAAMLLALKCEVLLMGLVGRDDVAQIPATTAMIGWRVVDGLTTTKTRLWCQGRLMGPRIDQDQSARSTDDDIRYFLRSLEPFLPDMIIIADHGKGVVIAKLMQRVGELKIPVLVDPIHQTPLPLHPAAIAGGTHELGPDASAADVIIEKRGAAGLAWRTAGNPTEEVVLPSTCRSLVDPLGAGDQFIASLAYQRCLGIDWPDAINWANHAAGLQCEQPGCQPLNRRQIDHFIQQLK